MFGHLDYQGQSMLAKISPDGDVWTLYARGEPVGTLRYRDGCWHFEGDVDASARALFATLELYRRPHSPSWEVPDGGSD